MPEQDNTPIIVGGLVAGLAVATVAGIVIYNAMQDGEEPPPDEEPEITINPTTGPVGTDINIMGSNFPPLVELEIRIGGITVQPWPSDPDGNFSTVRPIPSGLSVGNTNVIVSGGAATATAVFQITTGGDGQGTPITGISFNSGNERNRDECDNWAVTWLANDEQIGVWGDGPRTNNSNKFSLGVDLIGGTPSNPTFSSRYGGNDGGGGKSYAILAVENDLYMARTPGSGTQGYAEYRIWRSTNGGSNWSTNGPRWTRDETDTIKPAFLQFDRGYTRLPAHAAGFIYMYVIELTRAQSSLSEQVPGRIYLLRRPISNLSNNWTNKDLWEWFTGTPLNPTWGDIDDRNPIFTQSRGVGWNLSVIYNLALQRYILCTEHTKSFQGNMQFWDAPRPWGPWHKIQDVKLPNGVFYGNFSQKWMSSNGRNFAFVYTGIDADGQEWDSCNIRTGSFSTT
jgi:hypothetical protein